MKPALTIGSAQLYTGDALHVLAALPDESVHCIVTSPPYYALRDYGVEPTDWPACSYRPFPGMPAIDVPAMRCALGLERGVDAFLAHMVLIFTEARRVLRKDGTAWVNMGDGYAGSGGLTPHMGPAAHGSKATEIISRRADKPQGLKLKELIGMPWRLAFALQASGWYLRSDIIWHKPAPMPESCKDRATKAHEYLFQLSRKRKYYFDRDAWAEPCSPNTHLRVSQDVAAQRGSARAYSGSKRMKAVAGWASGDTKHDAIAYTSATGKKTKYRKEADHDAAGPRPKNNDNFNEAMNGPAPKMRNRRTVWTVPSEPYSGAHFATFPRALVEPCILAGCPKGGVVLDFFSGTATTGEVAITNGRRYIGIEVGPHNNELARTRLEHALVPKSARPKPRRKPPAEAQRTLAL